MTKARYFNGGGGSLNPVLCTSPKGGGAHDRAKYGSHLPVSGGRLPAYRESHASGHELARHKLGAGTGAYADGCQRHLPCWKRGWRGTAYADTRRNAISYARNERMDHRNRGQRRCYGAHSKCIPSNLQQLQPNYKGYGRRPAAQQFATVSRGVYLAADILTPERGCVA